MSGFLKRTISGIGNKPANKLSDKNKESLSTAKVPISEVDCHSCVAKCDGETGDFEDFPKNFDSSFAIVDLYTLIYLS